jgi:hypothetical protein
VPSAGTLVLHPARFGSTDSPGLPVRINFAQGVTDVGLVPAESKEGREQGIDIHRTRASPIPAAAMWRRHLGVVASRFGLSRLASDTGYRSATSAQRILSVQRGLTIICVGGG